MLLRIKLVLCFCLLAGSGCSRPPAPGKGGTGNTKNSTPEDSLQIALDSLSRAATLTDYKEALHLLNKHMSKTENQDAIRLSKEDRAALANRFGLEKDEMEVVETRTFRPLDAHHLEMCFLLREAARTIDTAGLEPLEQARLSLAWVDRQVLLREGSGNLLPPLYALRAGQGSTRERALVFLALLQQFRIPACVVLWPDADRDKQGLVLVGVLIARGEQHDVYLFDPRLGQPVFGPQGIATLAEVRKDPKLVPSAGVKSNSAPEILLACSLPALAPRMKYLEGKLARGERVVLAAEPAKLLAQFKAAAGDVKVWDLPLRVLSAFLPAVEGGIDKIGRLGMFEAKRISILPVAQHYAAMRLLGEDLPVKQAQLILLNFAQQLFTKYAQEPHALVLNGQHDKAIKRLQIMRAALDDLEFSPLADFGKRLDTWREAVRLRYLAVIRELPRAKEAAEALWNRDQYLVTLLHSESPDPQKHAKEELTYIVLTAVKDSLGEQTLYLLAEAWHEKAERNQATWERLKKAGKGEGPIRRAAENAHSAWSNVRGWWKKYEERHPLAWAGLEARFRTIQRRWQKGDQEQALSLWDLFLSEVHRAAAARLFLVQACRHLGQGKEATASLVKLEEDLTSLLENAEIKKELAAALEKVRGQGNPIQAAILDNLSRDLGPDGGFHGLREKVHAQLQTLKNEK